MTILPKKKSSQQSKSDRDGADRGVDSVQYSPRGLSQNQAVVQTANTAPGWGPNVGSASGASGWSPPPSEPALWVGSGPACQVSASVPDAGSKKKRSQPTYPEFEENGPVPSKRRMREEDASETEAGYNSEDEYNHLGVQLSEEEWLEKDRKFEQVMRKKGYIIKLMIEDGSCLFRAVADQLYGDQEMHVSVRDQCMNYIAQNGDYFSQYLTEDISEYVARKRYLGVHGNHLEIQALSEMYNRPIHIYCYSAEPINTFQGMNKTDVYTAPIRLCYHRLCHYNSLVDPYKPTIGVGLGLPGFNPGSADRNQVKQAVKNSEEDLVEKTMLEDKIRATDWEATNEAIEEQVARESYLQWLRDNERRAVAPPAATVTSADLKIQASSQASSGTDQVSSSSSPSRAKSLQEQETKAARSSPKPGCSHSSEPNNNPQTSPKAGCSSQRDSPKPCSSSSQHQKSPEGDLRRQQDYGLGHGFALQETASFLNRLPPNMFGLDDWSDTDVLTQVLAASQQEYLDSLKQAKEQETASQQQNSKSRRSSSDSNQDKNNAS